MKPAFSHQDWNVVVLKPKTSTTQGGDGSTPHRVHDATACKNKKLDQETEDFHHKHVPRDLSALITRARIEKKLTRVQLARSLNMQESKIGEIENGSAIYNGAELAKIKRFLGITNGPH
jgi:ribosome-binding protein aMBF1 (putative translation factor)